MTTDEKLDSVLRRLNQEHDDYFRNNKQTEDDYLTVLEIASTIPGMDEIQLIIEYLCDVEKLILRKNETDGRIRYKILWEGKVFIENGGYVSRQKAKKAAEKSGSRKETSLMVGTWLAGVGATGLVIVEIWKILHPSHR